MYSSFQRNESRPQNSAFAWKKLMRTETDFLKLFRLDILCIKCRSNYWLVLSWQWYESIITTFYLFTIKSPTDLLLVQISESETHKFQNTPAHYDVYLSSPTQRKKHFLKRPWHKYSRFCFVVGVGAYKKRTRNSATPKANESANRIADCPFVSQLVA